MNKEYLAYLNRLYTRASAARRKKARANIGEPCAICGQEQAEYTVEGIFLCRPHRLEKESLQPKYTLFQKLERIGVQYPSEQDFLAGLVKEKHRPLPPVKYPLRGRITEWQMGFEPMKNKRAPRKKK